MRAEARPVTRTRWTAVAYGATAALGLAAFLLYWGGVRDGLSWQRGLALRAVAPDFVERDPGSGREIPDFRLPDRWGRAVSLSQFRGVDLLLVNIWSSTCAACREEVPELTELDRRLASIGGAALLTIAVERKWDDVAHYFPRGTDLRILFDGGNAVAKGIFRTERYPETFVLDRRRRVLARFDGKRPWHSDAMLEYLRSLL
jgi:cytochrome c biogenesis protein CcmG/thiol:disulfide interchange protein DsbE